MSNPSSLLRGVSSEIVKATTLRAWWIGSGLVLLLTFYYAASNANLFAELMASEQNGYFTDFDGSLTSVPQAVRESLLASPYQSSALLLPLLTTFIAGTEYGTNQIVQSRLITPNPRQLLLQKFLASSLLCVLVVAVAFLLSFVTLKAMLPSVAAELLTGGLTLRVFAVVVAFALTMNLVAEAFTASFRRTIPALLMVLLLLLLALSGVLGLINPVLANVIPMIGAKTLLFGYEADSNAFSTAQGVALLAVWATASLALWFHAYRGRRDL